MRPPSFDSLLLPMTLGLVFAAALLASSAPGFPIPSWAHVAPEQIAEANKHGVPVAFENDLGMRFVLIPAGTFLMGSPEDEVGRDLLENQHEVTLTRPYYVQTTEVTNGQFRRFRPEHDSEEEQGQSLNRDTQPVVHVSWNDAVAFSEWLGEYDPTRSYRLPTEAEWERACRAGTTTPFWWGVSISKKFVNHEDDPASGGPLAAGFQVMLPVGKLPPNPWGLHDVHGNAREWCSDWYDDEPYPPGPATDPQGPPPSGSHCTRGGSSSGEYPGMLRAAWRIGVQGDDEARSYVGFRLSSPRPKR